MQNLLLTARGGFPQLHQRRLEQPVISSVSQLCYILFTFEIIVMSHQVGLLIADGKPGPFRLEIEWIKALRME
jgi:hypothetical protein